MELAELIGLLHDIGRFEQIKRYNTFIDKNSINHGQLGVKILFDDNQIRRFIKDSKYDDIIDGLIVCGSPSKNKAAAFGLKIIKIMEKIKGDKHRSKLIKKLMFGGYNKKGELPNNWICTNNEIVKKYNEDELCQYEYTLNGYENIVRLMLDTYNPKIYSKEPTPSYIIHCR